MMKLVLPVALAFVLTSCGGDSGEKVMADQFQHWENLAVVLNDLAADGNTDAAVKKLERLGETAREIEQRKKKLIGELGTSQRQEFESQFQKQAFESASKLTAAIQNVDKSGHATDKIMQAILAMKAK